ncbi:hypothetical protein AURDEDRAFT_149902 [Auricularia subglabra TFB-10046 SS5]|nr:hypothetical protein AURDEDRAFT_149902 [Auricularia subglabra TFB-10046 SS5]
MCAPTTSTPHAVSNTNISLPPLHTLNLLPDRIVLPSVPQLIAPKLIIDDSTHSAPFEHVPRRPRSSSTTSSSSVASSPYPLTPSSPMSSPSSTTSSRSRSPSFRLVPANQDDANVLLWLPDTKTHTPAVLLTGAAVSKHLRSLERERGRAHPYRVVFNRRASTTFDRDDMPTVSLRKLRASSEESN